MAPPLFPSARPTADLFRRFSFDRVIGEGQFGRVWRCLHVSSGCLFACKQIRKSRLSAHDLDSLRSEVSSMERLRGHPHVLQLLGLFEDEKTVYMVTDLCDTGDLFSLVSQAKGLTEQAAAVIFSQIADALRWCHVHDIVHRDIKPENVLLATRKLDNGKKQLEACLGDFGLALQIPKGYMLRGAAGSAPYEAPEVVSSEAYGVGADVWSLGVLLYAMLSAKLPSFPSDKRVLRPDVDFSVAPWPLISEEAKDLIRRMMTVDASERLDIQQVLQHPWVTKRVPAATIGSSSQPVLTQQNRPNGGQPIKRTRPDVAAAGVPAAHWLASSPLPGVQKLSLQAQCDINEGSRSPGAVQQSSKRRLLKFISSSGSFLNLALASSPSSPRSPASPFSPSSSPHPSPSPSFPSSPSSSPFPLSSASSPLSSASFPLSSPHSPLASPLSPLSSPSSSPDCHSLGTRPLRQYRPSRLAPCAT